MRPAGRCRRWPSPNLPRFTVTPQLRVGLGWHISRPVDRDLVWHNGQTGGSHGLIALDQARHTAVVVLSNSVSSIDDIGVHLLDERVELAAAEERPELTLAAGVLERYVGVYQLVPDGTVTVTQTERGLVAEATGLGIAPIYPASETEFFVKVINVQLTFQLDSTGAVTGLVLHHGGRDLPGRSSGREDQIDRRTTTGSDRGSWSRRHLHA